MDGEKVKELERWANEEGPLFLRGASFLAENGSLKMQFPTNKVRCNQEDMEYFADQLSAVITDGHIILRLDGSAESWSFLISKDSYILVTGRPMNDPEELILEAFGISCRGEK